MLKLALFFPETGAMVSGYHHRPKSLAFQIPLGPPNVCLRREMESWNNTQLPFLLGFAAKLVFSRRCARDVRLGPGMS